MQSVDQNRSEWLDVLRGIAILGVVSVHSIALTDSLNLKAESLFFTKIIESGKYGVELFFFLSGWLLASIYGLNNVKPIGGSYWLRRFARIYPLWLIFFLITLLRWQANNSGPLKSIFLNATDDSSFFLNPLVIIVLSLTFTLFLSASLWNSVIPGGWSIQAEVAHYLLFPLMRNRKINAVLSTVATINLITALLYIMRQELGPKVNLPVQILDSWLRLGLFSTLSFFLLGILGFTVSCSLHSSSKVKDFFTTQRLSPSLCLYFLLSSLIVPAPFGSQIEAIGFLGASLITGFLVLNYKKLSMILRLFGRYSYFIYFMHFVVLDLVRSISKAHESFPSFILYQPIFYLITFVFTLSVSLCAAIPSFRIIEQPIIRLAHRFGVTK